MNMHTSLIALISVSVISGCSSIPTPPQAALGTPDHRIFRKELVEKKVGAQEVKFVRDQGFPGTSEQAILDINKEPFAAVEKGEKLSIWLAPGTYKVGATPGIRDYQAQLRNEIEMTIKPSEQYLVRIVNSKIILKLEPSNF